MLAIGLCCMSLLITHSQDDLILAAGVSAGGGQFCIHPWPNCKRSAAFRTSNTSFWFKDWAGAMLRFSIVLGCTPTVFGLKNCCAWSMTIGCRCFPAVWRNLKQKFSCEVVHPQMLQDPHLLIIYPFAGFFYVAPENTELVAAIQTSFELLIADGS